jgi:hypothetical protein
MNINLKLLEYKYNPIHEIINSNDKYIINKRVKILNNFKYLYYCLKFKKRFRDLLWVKVREPKIRKRYSYEYLIENLHEESDLDTVLDNW